MAGNRTEKNPTRSTVMAKPEISGKGMKKLTRREQGQIKLKALHLV